MYLPWEDAYESCLESGGDDGIGQEDVVAAYADGVASVDITSDNEAIADEAYGSVMEMDLVQVLLQ